MHIRIEGRGVNLRRLARSDAQSIYQYARDSEISKFTFVPHPYRRQDALRFIKFADQQMRKKREYHLGIELNTVDRIIGMVGLAAINEKDKNAEIGYWLGHEFWGRGYAMEALGLMLQYGFKELKLLRIWARVMHPNLASARLLEKVGFTFEGRLRKNINQNGRLLDELRYGILKEEYKM